MRSSTRLLWIGLGGAVALLAGLVVLSLVGGAGRAEAHSVAKRWVEVHDWKVQDCSVLGLYTDEYLEAHGFSADRCEENPESFFTYWFMESETQGSGYELIDVDVQGESAVAEVEEAGGKVPQLRLFLVLSDGEWRIEAVGAALS
jgi:hypothetical protein